MMDDDPEWDLLYIAKKLRIATALEAALIEAGIEYTVEPDEYQGGVIFRRTRIGAFFYVPPESRDAALAVLRDLNP